VLRIAADSVAPAPPTNLGTDAGDARCFFDSCVGHVGPTLLRTYLPQVRLSLGDATTLFQPGRIR
jgi:hypothetical protein